MGYNFYGCEALKRLFKATGCIDKQAVNLGNNARRDIFATDRRSLIALFPTTLTDLQSYFTYTLTVT